MIKQVNINDIPASRGDGRVIKDVRMLLKNGWEAAEVDISCYKNIRTARNSYMQVISRADYPVSVITRNEKLYLVRREEKQ